MKPAEGFSNVVKRFGGLMRSWLYENEMFMQLKAVNLFSRIHSWLYVDVHREGHTSKWQSCVHEKINELD